MIQAEDFILTATKFGFELYTGVPCSYLKPFINYVIDSPNLKYIGATNEGDSVAIASGAELAAKKSVVMFQNSGFGNTVNPLTSLNAIFKIPVLIITTLRGEPGGKADEPQHALMGQITSELFDIMKIKWEYFPTEPEQIEAVLSRAVAHMNLTQLPYGLIMKHGSVADHKLKSKPEIKSNQSALIQGEHFDLNSRPLRREVIQSIQKVAKKNDLYVATTGFTGRVLYALDDKPNQLYMVGSMGCASSFGLGLALSSKQLRVIVIDGDGAALMRLGAFATIGYERPRNLIHILIDNEAHDSTGGQSTVTHSVDLASIAKSCGYPKVLRINNLVELENILNSDSDELTFIHIKTKPGESDDLPRPTVTPVQVAERFRKYIHSVST